MTGAALEAAARDDLHPVVAVRSGDLDAGLVGGRVAGAEVQSVHNLQSHVGTAPRAMAAFRNLAIGALKILGTTNIAKTTGAIAEQPERALPILGIRGQLDLSGT